MKKLLALSLVPAFALLQATAARAADSAETWAHNCASCHGKDGAGHTKAGKKLGVKDLTDAQYQKSFTDDQAFKDLKGGLKTKEGGDAMKPFGGKLSDDDIKGLVAHVRTFAK